MPWHLNHAGISRARSLAKSGKVTDASFDESTIPRDTAHADHFLAIDSGYSDSEHGHYKCPVISASGELSLHALANAAARSSDKSPEVSKEASAIHELAKPDEPKVKMSFAIAPDPRPPIPTPEGMPGEISGVKCFYVKREIAHTGRYKHPTYGFSLNVTDMRNEHWCQQGNKMVDDGVEVPVLCDHKESAKETIGYIKKFSIEQNKLIGLFQLIGPDALDICARNYVSPGIEMNFTDGQQRHWRDAIVEVSLVPRPVMPGQETTRLAASLTSSTDDEPFIDVEDKTFWSHTMAEGKTFPMSDPDYEMMCSLVPDLHKAPRELTMAHVSRHLQTMHKMMGIHPGMRMSLGTETANVELLKGETIKPLDGENADLAVEAAMSKMDKVTALSEDQRKRFSLVFIKNDKGDLSPGLTTKGLDGKRLTFSMIDMVAEIKPAPVVATTAATTHTPAVNVTTGTQVSDQTAAAQRQTFSIERAVPGNENAVPKTDPALIAEMVQSVNAGWPEGMKPLP